MRLQSKVALRTCAAVCLLFGILGGVPRPGVARSQSAAATLVSETAAGKPSRGYSTFTYGLERSTNLNGRYVIFGSDAPGIVRGAPRRSKLEEPAMYLRDVLKGRTEAVASRNGRPVGGALGSISDDGRYVSFASRRIRIGKMHRSGAFLWDRQRQRATWLGNGYHPQVARDGSLVAFLRCENRACSRHRLYEHDVSSGRTKRIVGEQFDELRQISSDNRFVLLVKDNVSGIALVDRQAGKTITVSPPGEDRYAANMSADGKFIVFGTETALSDLDRNRAGDCYIVDRDTRAVSLVSADAEGQAVGVFSGCIISEDGTRAAFATRKPLVDRDTNGKSNLYLRDLQTGHNTLIPARRAKDRYIFPGSFSADGKHLTVQSVASLQLNDSALFTVPVAGP